jgi:Lrp/AsnC family transcriptional regulator, regulator for asnA, asnC and gidA
VLPARVRSIQRKDPVELDPIELQILSELQRDGRVTTQELAKRVGVSEVTARRKLRRLTGEEIVRVVGVVDPFRVGYKSPVWMGVKVARERLDEVAEQLVAHPAVRYVALATGNFHLLVELMAATNQEVARYLMEDFNQIEGIIDTETSLILRIYKQMSDWTIAPEAAGPAESSSEHG